ncbi:Utp3, partial [Symbiodinium microadriaticum]
TLSRKDKKSMKRREKLSQSQDMVADIGDIGDFEDLTALSNSIAVKASSSSGAPSAAASMSGGADLSGALQKAVSALMGGETNGKKGKKRSTAEYDTDGLQNHRRPVPSTDDYASDEGGAFGADDDDDLMETFARKKKEFAKKKVEHYTAPARIGGREEVVADGAKRAASYEIMSNRGLTPHRKKSNRNPRVKKREAFAKAVVARKGQVRDVISGSDVAYGGEATGIKSNLSRSRRIGT